MRWVVPSVAAFAIGAAGVLGSLYARDVFESPELTSVPAHDTASGAAGAKSPTGEAPAAIDAAPTPVPTPTPEAQAAPLVAASVRTQATAPPQAAAARTLTPLAASPVARASENNREIAVQAPALRPISRPLRTFDPATIALAVPNDTRENEASRRAPNSSIDSRDSAAAGSVADEFAVRRVLVLYQAAFEKLDVDAAADVWPSVDRGALARAFGALTSQGVKFQRCSVSVQDAGATAHCRGTLRVVPKVGSPSPQTTEQQWDFKMRRTDGAWKIDDVSASRPGPTERPREEG